MSAMLIGVLLPLGAVATYLALGETDALDPQKVQAAAEQHPELQTMAESLARKLETEGGTVQRWMMLARTYRTLEQYDKALPAYAQAVALGGGDDVQLERAEVLAITRGGNFQGEPLQVIEKVLRKNPHHYQALLLAGSAAYAESRLQQALTYWQKAQAQLQPSDGDTDELNQAIAKVKEQLGQQPDKPTTPPAASTLSGRVELGELARGQFAASDTVFVYATATQGPRAPLAIVRTTVAQLPMSFVLDDTTAMNAEHKLSGQSAVWVKARVSKSGQAMPQPGDWVGTIGPVVPGSKDIRLVINEKLP
jgi:cytochrome c-type biogenesis protein CcmH